MNATLAPIAKDEPSHRRVFFALWPDAALRTELLATFGAAAEGAGGRPVPATNLHVTLEFLGAVAEARQGELEALGERIEIPAAELVLDTVDWWPRPALLAAGSRAPAQALIDLQAALRRLLANAGFRVDARAYRPHVTLARKVTCQPPAAPLARVSWPIRELALVESLPGADGSRYAPLASWTR